MKKGLPVLLLMLMSLMLLFTLPGCGIKEKITKKTGEKLTEKMLEKAGAKDVKIDDDKVSMKDEEGNKITIGGTKWPTSAMVKNIPEFTEGKVSSVIDTAEYVFISLETVKKADFEDYLAKIKKDYTENTFEMNGDGSLTYGASNADGINVQLQYSDEKVTITIGKTAK